MGGPGGKERRGERRPRRARRARARSSADAGAESRAVAFCKIAALTSVSWRRRFPRWSDCTAHRREHKVSADCATAGTCEPGAPGGRGARGQEIEWHRFWWWSGVRRASGARVGRRTPTKLRAEGARRAPRGRGEDRGAGHLQGGADWDLRPSERTPGPRSCPLPRASAVQVPGRGDRGTGRRAASVALARWSGRPCGRSRDDAGAQVKQRRRRHGRPRGRRTAAYASAAI